MRRITFSRNKGTGYRTYTQTFEFNDNATEEEITAAYEEWCWEEVADEFTWYEET